ncbi:MAG TPA: DUF4331 domain-containing protein [Polyangiaceae bacterium]|nr:DUF4331 domain-containing protein [Polyangiaceae bacterium]
MKSLPLISFRLLRGALITTALLTTAFCGTALASSHREAPAIADDPAADNTDLYAWLCEQPSGKALCVVANYNPLELPEGGPNYHKFSDDVLYQIHVTHNDAKGRPSLLDYIVFDIRFETDPIQRVDVADPKAPPGGGKEFFAQLSQAFSQKVSVRARYSRGTDYGNNSGFYFENEPSRVIFDRVPVAPPNIGQRTATFAYGNPNYDDFAKTFIKSNKAGYRLFAGPRDDAFYVNLGQIFDLGAIVGLNSLNGQPFRSQKYDVNPNANGTFANTDPTKALDGVAGFNVHSIALAIPLKELAPPGKEKEFDEAVNSGQPSNKTLFGVWASSMRRFITSGCFDNSRACRGGVRGDGPWRQVSRLGLPLINEAVIGIQDKDKFNRTTPLHDVNNFGAYFLNPIIVRDVEAIGGYAQLGIDQVPDDFKFGRTDILQVINLDDIPTPGAHQVEIANGRTGDVLRVDVAVPSAFPNGRPLSGPAVKSGKEEDVTDIELSLLLSKLTVPISDYVNGPGDGRKLLPEFPYLGSPFAGDTEGKGSPAQF